MVQQVTSSATNSSWWALEPAAQRNNDFPGTVCFPCYVTAKLPGALYLLCCWWAACGSQSPAALLTRENIRQCTTEQLETEPRVIMSHNPSLSKKPNIASSLLPLLHSTDHISLATAMETKRAWLNYRPATSECLRRRVDEGAALVCRSTQIHSGKRNSKHATQHSRAPVPDWTTRPQQARCAALLSLRAASWQQPYYHVFGLGLQKKHSIPNKLHTHNGQTRKLWSWGLSSREGVRRWGWKPGWGARPITTPAPEAPLAAHPLSLSCRVGSVPAVGRPRAAPSDARSPLASATPRAKSHPVPGRTAEDLDACLATIQRIEALAPTPSYMHTAMFLHLAPAQILCIAARHGRGDLLLKLGPRSSGWTGVVGRSLQNGRRRRPSTASVVITRPVHFITAVREIEKAGACEEIWVALNEVFRADEVWSGVVKGRAGKREIPEKTSRPAISSSTITTCGNPGATWAGIEPCLPWWEASRLTAQPSQPPGEEYKAICDIMAVMADRIQTFACKSTRVSEEIWAALNIEVLRAYECDLRSQIKPAEQRHHLAQSPHAKIREQFCQESNTIAQVRGGVVYITTNYPTTAFAVRGLAGMYMFFPYNNFQNIPVTQRLKENHNQQCRETSKSPPEEINQQLQNTTFDNCQE
ncbi:hypothetical protein PR048_027256 [Dryococelus australis]|uniref:Uncharacterized protein n=1 Tax=Dryococelus australis TaxID=614101 RepID=A0ABQ9GEY6_9NEOP|nr:hypothetical protein PR048_027256 [Dryococelus australis]